MAIGRSSPETITIPKGESEYPAWLKTKLDYDVHQGRVEYDAASSRLVTKFASSNFWSSVSTELRDMQERFKLRTTYDLFYKMEMPPLLIKSCDSFLNKTFRKNFIRDSPANTGDNISFPPEQWYAGTDDVVRTTFVTKYLDGVEALLDEFSMLADANAMIHRREWKANDNGYYAAHYYIQENIDIPLVKGGMKHVKMWIEIQITTQLQEVLRQFSHEFYQKLRMSTTATEILWQWRYKEDEFFANYLGHLLHNVEGMIMEVRRRQEAKNADI